MIVSVRPHIALYSILSVCLLGGCADTPPTSPKTPEKPAQALSEALPVDHRGKTRTRRYTHPSIPSKWDAHFAQATRRYYPHEYGEQWHREKAKCWTESHFRVDVASHVGAVGICQFMEATFREVAHKHHIHGGRRNPTANIQASAAYSGELVRKFYAPRPDECRWQYANGAYNAGFARIRKTGRAQGWPECPDTDDWPQETRDYVVKIERTIALLEGTDAT